MKKFEKAKWAKGIYYRASGLQEDVCKHGVGHPNLASLKAMQDRGLEGFEVHGCDGCCVAKRQPVDKKEVLGGKQ